MDFQMKQSKIQENGMNIYMQKKGIALMIFCFNILSVFPLTGQTTDLSYVTSGGVLNPIQANMDIRHYTLALDVDIPARSFKGTVTVEMILGQNADTIQLDLVHTLKVGRIKVNDKMVAFSQTDDKIFITSEKGFSKGRQKVAIDYGGVPPVPVRAPWDGGFNWSTDRNGNPWMAINCQSEGGKFYFPCKDHPSDEPNEGADLFITIPKGLVVAGPGLLQEVTTRKQRSTYHWKTNYTISNYCIVFNIGKYKVVSRKYTTINGNVVPMQFYVLEEDTAHAEKVLDTKARDTRILEKYFGEYPWVKEKIGIAEVPNSGMEHQTMITFNNGFKYVKIGGHDYSDNLFHEYAHEWWANKVTNKDWAHMWIQEGIATYAEALAHFEWGGQEAYDENIGQHRRYVTNKKAVVQGEQVTEEATYTRDIYFKGSFFMHSLRYLIGDSIFFPTLKKLATDPKYTYDNFVTTTDVEQLFSSASGKDLKPFFDFFLRTTEVLEFTVKEIDHHKYQVSLGNYFMPLPLELNTDKGPINMIMSKEGIRVESNTPPIVDPKGYYLKKVTQL